jgi:hypothetical protein
MLINKIATKLESELGNYNMNLKNSRGCPTEPETIVPTIYTWGFAHATSNPAEAVTITPVTASHHTEGSCLRTFGTYLRAITIIFLVIPVPAPFMDVSAHVIQAQLISLFFPNRTGIGESYSVIPRHLFTIIRATI